MIAENIKKRKKICYNFGGGPKRIEGFINIDALSWNGITDIIWDLTNTPYTFVTEPVDEIMAIEFLEHISFRDTWKVLKEWYRILRVGGKLVIQVPDCGKMMEYYVNGLVCDCVPHKVQKRGDFKADPNCWECRGKAKVNPKRWLYSFTGAQKHFPHDLHKNIFTKEILREAIESVGFKKVEFKENVNKLVVVAFK